MSTHSSSAGSIKSEGSTYFSELPIGKVQLSGVSGEYVIIGKHKYFRHELMSAFGGNLNPGLSPWPKTNFNPAPLGLAAFAFTTFVLSLYNAKAMGITVPNVVVGTACFYGGAIQLICGALEIVAGNTFGATALSSYGAFWLSFASIYLESFGISAAYGEDAVMLGNAVGFFLLGWCLFTLMLVLTSIKSTLAFFSLFFFLFLTFLFLAIGEFTGIEGIARTGGVLGIITALLGWYNAFAGIATHQNSYFVLNSIQLNRNK